MGFLRPRLYINGAFSAFSNIGMFLVLPCLIQEHVFLASTAMANEAIIKEVAMVMADVCHLKTEASQVLQKEMFARQREALHQQQIKIRSSEAENSYGTPVHKPVIGFVPVNLISIIKEMYEEVDSEQKGYITPGQLRRVLARLHFKIDNRDFKRLIRAIDRNHTRQINYKEWESLILDQEVALDDEDFAQSLDSDLNEAVLSADNLSVGSRRLVSSGSTSAMNHLATHYSNPIRQGSSLPLDCISEEQLMLSEYATVANRGSADDEDIDGDQDNTYACESEMKMGKHPETLKTVMTREHGSRLSNEVVSLSNEQEAKERKAKSFTHNTNAVVPRDESRTKETRGNFVQEQLQLLRCFGEVLLRCEGCNRMVPMHRALAHTRHCSATKAADNGFFNHSHKINVRTARESLLDINNARTLHRI